MNRERKLSPGGLSVIVKLDGLKPVRGIDQRRSAGKKCESLPASGRRESSECQNVPCGVDVRGGVVVHVHRPRRVSPWRSCCGLPGAGQTVRPGPQLVTRLKARWRFRWHRCIRCYSAWLSPILLAAWKPFRFFSPPQFTDNRYWRNLIKGRNNSLSQR